MNSDFPRILTLLRKEQGISQKKAAADLGISQALLSHYEKGIRECGLDFIVRTADYYGVSCDYLLGKTPHRQGEKLHRMQLARAKSRVMLLGEKVSDDEAVKKDDLPQLSGEMLSAEYPDWAPSLFALIENTENEHKEN